MNKNIKRLIYVLLVVPIVYISLLLVIDFDVNNKRPILNVFKLLQNEGSQEIVDFSIEGKEDNFISNPNKDRNPYYGDLHVHTKYSFDAYVFGVTASPDDAYRYAKGEGIKHPLGYEMKLREPLDFYSVTDHGFFMGMIEAYADTSSNMSKLEITKPFQIGRAHVRTPVTEKSRMPSSA